jgi:hypothetical protein
MSQHFQTIPFLEPIEVRPVKLTAPEFVESDESYEASEALLAARGEDEMERARR